MNLMLFRMITIMVLLLVCMITDIQKSKVNILVCLTAFLLGISFDIISIIEGGSILPIIVALIPGVLFIALSGITSGSVGIGDGIVILTLGSLTDIGHIICGLSVALLMTSVIALLFIVILHKEGKSSIPFIPFLFAGMICAFV